MSFSQVLVEEFLHPDIEYFLVLYGLYGHELGCILLVEAWGLRGIPAPSDGFCAQVIFWYG